MPAISLMRGILSYLTIIGIVINVLSLNQMLGFGYFSLPALQSDFLKISKLVPHFQVILDKMISSRKTMEKPLDRYKVLLTLCFSIIKSDIELSPI